MIASGERCTGLVSSVRYVTFRGTCSIECPILGFRGTFATTMTIMLCACVKLYHLQVDELNHMRLRHGHALLLTEPHPQPRGPGGPHSAQATFRIPSYQCPALIPVSRVARWASGSRLRTSTS